jgi:hypothetical protein
VENLGGRAGGAGNAGRRAPAQHRVDAREELARIEGLGEVVVGPHLQAHDAVDVVTLRGEHDDGRCIVLPAKAAADREAVLAWQHEIEHEEVVALARELLVHAPGIGHRLHLVALAAEVAHQKVPQSLVVVDHQDACLQFRHGR